MIAWLQGTIIDRNVPGKLVLDVHGVGYDVETSLNTFFQLEGAKQQVTLHIHTIVREDALLLYGFINHEERALFRALIKVNGIGPKTAIAILSSINPTEFVQCIQQENIQFLTKLPGIGKKTAERLLIEMRDSIKHLNPIHQDTASAIGAHLSGPEAISALEALGYKPQEAQKAIKKIDDGFKNAEQLIREGLKLLSSHSV